MTALNGRCRLLDADGERCPEQTAVEAGDVHACLGHWSQVLRHIDALRAEAIALMKRRSDAHVTRGRRGR